MSKSSKKNEKKNPVDKPVDVWWRNISDRRAKTNIRVVR